MPVRNLLSPFVIGAQPEPTSHAAPVAVSVPLPATLPALPASEDESAALENPASPAALPGKQPSGLRRRLSMTSKGEPCDPAPAATSRTDAATAATAAKKRVVKYKKKLASGAASMQSSGPRSCANSGPSDAALTRGAAQPHPSANANGPPNGKRTPLAGAAPAQRSASPRQPGTPWGAKRTASPANRTASPAKRTGSPASRTGSPQARPSPRREYVCPVAPASPAKSTVIKDLREGAGRKSQYSAARIRYGTPDTAATSLRSILSAPLQGAEEKIGRSVSEAEAAQLQVYRAALMQRRLAAAREGSVVESVERLRELRRAVEETILEGGEAERELLRLTASAAEQQVLRDEECVNAAKHVLHHAKACHSQLAHASACVASAMPGATVQSLVHILSASGTLLSTLVDAEGVQAKPTPPTHLHRAVHNELLLLAKNISTVRSLATSVGSKSAHLLQINTALARMGE